MLRGSVVQGDRLSWWSKGVVDEKYEEYSEGRESLTRREQSQEHRGGLERRQGVEPQEASPRK